MKKFLDQIINRTMINRYRLWLGYKTNEIGIYLQLLSRQFILSMYPELKGEDFQRKFIKLHKEINGDLRKQKKEYPFFIYEQGYPYQALQTLGIFGARPTEIRFSDYGLADLINRGDRVLDIGCNCGFMLIYTCFRTDCTGDGIDINPYMISIGQRVAEFLGLSNKIHLSAKRFQDFEPNGKYSVIFSFASHWTDDEQLRPDFDEYMKKLHDLLSDNGLLVFESHTADINNIEFDKKMERQRNYFSWSGSKLLYNNQRELFIMRKKVGK